jgi:hypothetical protein
LAGKTEAARLLQDRYKNVITKTDIDDLAALGINTLRVPTMYSAWIDVPDMTLLRLNQTAYLGEIATYAIEKYDMHIVVGLHGLPGGINAGGIGEAIDHNSWWNNQTNLEYSYQALREVFDFVQRSGYPNHYTISPINEASDNPAQFSAPTGLTDNGATWLAKYFVGCIDIQNNVNPKIPLMFQDSFKGEAFWAPHFDASANLVFDTHMYYFGTRYMTSDALALPSLVCTLGRNGTLAGDSKFPVVIGEWALQAYSNNTLARRKLTYDVQRTVYSKYVSGSIFWTAKHSGKDTLNGEGLLEDYWSFLDLAAEGVVKVDATSYQC